MAEGPPRPGIPIVTPTRTAKIVIIGSASTGKTSLRNRYAKGHFSQAYIATIGADFVTKKVELQDGSGDTVALQLWDTAGQERFQALGAAFYRGADACILVYALNSSSSLHQLKSWYTSFLDRCPVPEGQERSFPFVCVGNKSDLVRSHEYARGVGNKKDEEVDLDEVKKMLEELCPPLEKKSRIKKTAQPSAVPSGSDTKPAKVSQEHELRTDDPSSSSQTLSKQRTRSSSRSQRSKRTDPKRRSLEILPDRRDTTTASSVRNPSVYHTPSSSLAQGSSTWLNGSKISSSSSGAETDESASGSVMKGKKKEKDSFVGQEYSTDGIPVGPKGTERAIEEEEEEEGGGSDYNSENEGDIHMNGHVPFHDDDVDDQNDATQENEEAIPTKDVFGAQDGIKHFTASAKSGEGIDEIFDYLVKRIGARWKWQDELDLNDGNQDGQAGGRGRLGNVRKGGPNDSIQVGKKLGNNEQKGWRSACC